MSPIYGQLSDKPLLPFADLYGVPDVKHNRDREIRRRASACRPAGLRPRCRFDFSRLNYTLNVGFWSITTDVAREPNVGFEVLRGSLSIPGPRNRVGADQVTAGTARHAFGEQVVRPARGYDVSEMSAIG
jgi:hypothetical protein